MKNRKSPCCQNFSLYSHSGLLPSLSPSPIYPSGFLFCLQSLMSIIATIWQSTELLSLVLNQICLWPVGTASILKDGLPTDWIQSVGMGVELSGQVNQWEYMQNRSEAIPLSTCDLRKIILVFVHIIEEVLKYVGAFTSYLIPCHVRSFMLFLVK